MDRQIGGGCRDYSLNLRLMNPINSAVADSDANGEGPKLENRICRSEGDKLGMVSG